MGIALRGRADRAGAIARRARRAGRQAGDRSARAFAGNLLRPQPQRARTPGRGSRNLEFRPCARRLGQERTREDGRDVREAAPDRAGARDLQRSISANVIGLTLVRVTGSLVRATAAGEGRAPGRTVPSKAQEPWSAAVRRPACAARRSATRTAGWRRRRSLPWPPADFEPRP